MKLHTTLKSALLAAIVAVLTGCTPEIRDQSSAEIQQQISVKSLPDSPNRILTAPDLNVQQFRMAFYGYNTVSYLLAAIKDDQSSGLNYQLQFDAKYGIVGSRYIRHYDMAKMQNGVVIPTTQLRHDALSCQMYGDMVNGCLFRDRANVAISLEQLQSGRQSGLTLILSSADKNYETLDLPAQYIDGFLIAVQNK
ncbi:hypothetical protein [Methylomonas sp. AM2-LC]|uniref:hypothetical protein n=1 Tax=Methylomonas sp. AM2-LC TaxID=3153301 RepID=UPI0032654113